LRQQAPLIVLLIVAGIVRVVATVQTSNSFLYPDELFQYLEQAHRHVFGYGVIPWEYRLGLRSWLYPLLLTVPMRLGDMLDPNGSLYLLLPRALAALSSLAIVWAAFALGRRLSVVHAIVAAFVVAIWFEFVLYSAHSLTESLSFNAFMIGAVLTSDARCSTPLLVGAGLAFGFAAILRFRHIPTIATFVLASRLPIRLWLPIIVGAAIAAVASAARGMPGRRWATTSARDQRRVAADGLVAIATPTCPRDFPVYPIPTETRKRSWSARLCLTTHRFSRRAGPCRRSRADLVERSVGALSRAAPCRPIRGQSVNVSPGSVGPALWSIMNCATICRIAWLVMLL
jgi:hypothetical protein